MPTPPPEIVDFLPIRSLSPAFHAGSSDDEDSSSDSISSGAALEVTRPRKSHTVSEPVSAVESKAEGFGNRPRNTSGSKRPQGHEQVRRLSAAGMQHLTEPESLPVAVVSDDGADHGRPPLISLAEQIKGLRQSAHQLPDTARIGPLTADSGRTSRAYEQWRRPTTGRTLSTPPGNRKDDQSRTSPPRRNSLNPSLRPPPLNLNSNSTAAFSTPKTTPATYLRPQAVEPAMPSPMPPSIPLPPMSIPTHLQLELSTQRPSPLYIHHSHTNDIPYESNAVKIERLKNVLLIPFYLERTLSFGTLACLDAWLYNFTILPIRFCVAVGVLIRWWVYVVAREAKWIANYVWSGLGRLWSRGRRPSVHAQCDECDAAPGTLSRSQSQSRLKRTASSHDNLVKVAAADNHMPRHWSPEIPSETLRHRRTKSMPSSLTSMHKADILQGAIILFSSTFLMNLDASRMYHVIRGQDAIKLFVIYNVLEVGDRLLSALGQDIFECLLSTEALSRNKSGRSKLLLPFGLFLLALVYNCIHSVALYYQVITLNVAVNSYSNALLTLLLSNQFVEVKSTVFKRFEKDNLFQLTCADITERFQLWLMLFIIGMRNVVEVGGLSIPGAGLSGDLKVPSTKPQHSPFILPHSFTVLPSWLWSGEVLSPFLIVIGSEILVDTIKHAYINKFNKIRPTFYSRILDILCKDYYTNAFVRPSLTRRVGLATLPLACLFIRASVQTYHMFVSTRVAAPIIRSTQTSLSEESATPSSPAMTAALDRLDSLLRDALGRAVYGQQASGSSNGKASWFSWSTDDVIAAVTMLVVFFIAFLVLLVFKILLSMILLRYSRDRYARMKKKEHLIATAQAEPDSYDAKGKRLGGYGHVEIPDEKKRWIHADKDEGLAGKGRPAKSDKPPEGEYHGVQRYEMVTKRIW
ncbi:transmembrane anterior posterior transformation 1 [Verticillium alfalfae VaMs.102]|uniref:Transmembrane anterior posterior transformation 1 n=1 Tax=Verticillium alfalfae (strain VaMs.102 / ATCC MYA-4576 / FGSC 10136) TaxID=526221 RepID=C9SYQ1_VERA1|nr:transmembrane anterior posterior transformation 1 [Verticillium alfalfae VaMs.102]EEY23916.1 transmembrane anterior posterior transformation 1 [Verticillium alfalfae VaMs.102]